MLSSRDIILEADETAELEPIITGSQLSLARLVIREAATNVLKYAPVGSSANLILDLLPNSFLSITMTNAIADQLPTASLTGGFGLINLQQRLTAVGGTFEYARSDHRWVVTATIPTYPMD